MMQNTFLRDLYNNNANYSKYSQQLSSGNRMLRASDDPIGTVRSVKVRQEQSALEQYQSNVKLGQNFLKETETAISEVNTIIQRLQELVGIGASDLYTTDQKTSAAYEVQQLRDELVSIGNANFNGQYIFGGYNTTKAPFVTDGNGGITFNGVDLATQSADLTKQQSQELSYKIDTSTFFPISVNGADLFGTGEDNLYTMLDNLAKDMMDDTKTSDDLSQYKIKINTALSKNLSILTEVGGRCARLELVESRFDDNSQNLEEKCSDIEDIDQAETITNYKFAEAAYNEALAVGAQIIQLSLLDYLR